MLLQIKMTYPIMYLKHQTHSLCARVNTVIHQQVLASTCQPQLPPNCGGFIECPTGLTSTTPAGAWTASQRATPTNTNVVTPIGYSHSIPAPAGLSEPKPPPNGMPDEGTSDFRAPSSTSQIPVLQRGRRASQLYQ